MLNKNERDAQPAMNTSCRIVVVGDIHGCLDSFVRVLQAAGLIDGDNHWCGSPVDNLVICGDMVDEGASSREVIALIRSLQQQAGEQVTALLGNHEFLLLRKLATSPRELNWETVWSWADVDPVLHTFLTSHAIPNLTTEGIRNTFQQSFILEGEASYPSDYIAAQAAITPDVAQEAARLFYIAIDRDGTLQWLQNLPVAQKIGEWGFFHGGPPKGFVGSIADLNRTFSTYFHAGEWQQPLLEPYSAHTSPIGSRRWWDGGEQAVSELLASYGLQHAAFGHSPGALNGTFGKLEQRWGKVFKADTYFSIGTEGYLEILSGAVWVVYNPIGREVFQRLYPQKPPLPERELLWSEVATAQAPDRTTLS